MSSFNLLRTVNVLHEKDVRSRPTITYSEMGFKKKTATLSPLILVDVFQQVNW